jgi:hypothetical protein
LWCCAKGVDILAIVDNDLWNRHIGVTYLLDCDFAYKMGYIRQEVES